MGGKRSQERKYFLRQQLTAGGVDFDCTHPQRGNLQTRHLPRAREVSAAEAAAGSLLNSTWRGERSSMCDVRRARRCVWDDRWGGLRERKMSKYPRSQLDDLGTTEDLLLLLVFRAVI